MQPANVLVTLSPWEPGLLALIIYSLMVFGLVGLLLFCCSFLGDRKDNPEKRMPYESGVIPTGPARLSYPVSFYRVAVFFLIFDVESAFIFSWAVSFQKLGWAGWFQVTAFIVLLVLGLFYVWKKGGLNWETEASTLY